MADNSLIEWCDATTPASFVTNATPPACRFCGNKTANTFTLKSFGARV